MRRGVRLGVLLGIVLGTAALAGSDRARAGSGLSAIQAPDSAPSRCLPADTIADQLLDTLRRMATAATGPFAERRSRLQLPTLSATTEVQQVTQGDRCAVAARAADSVWARAKISAHDAHRRVYLFMFGDFFVVADRRKAAGATAAVSSFSSDRRYLGTIRL